MIHIAQSVVSGVTRIWSQMWRGVRAHEIRQKSQQLLHKFTKLKNWTDYMYKSTWKNVRFTPPVHIFSCKLHCCNGNFTDVLFTLLLVKNV